MSTCCSTAANAAESGLWNAVDPNKDLTVGKDPVAATAKSIVSNQPKTAAQLSATESGIYQTAQDMGGVQPFSELTAMRSRVTDATRQARMDGDAQAGRRLDKMLGGIDDTIAGAVSDRAQSEQAAVQAGTLSPEQSMLAQINAWADKQHAGQSRSSNGSWGR